jgi:hypothetical protein
MKKVSLAVLLSSFVVSAGAAGYVQLPGHFGGFDSDQTVISVADEFQLVQNTSIASLVWWGADYGEVIDSFTAQLFSDSDGKPGALLSGFTIGPIQKTATGNFVNDPDLYPEYRYSAGLQMPFLALANAKYWLSIFNLGQPWLWEVSGSESNLGVQRTFHGEAWQPYYDNTAFQLVEVPEPASFSLIALGMVCSTLVLRKKKRASL